MRILAANIDLELAPRPVHKVLLATTAVIVAVAIRQLVLHLHRVWTKHIIEPS
jgi:hypothetical protein